VSLRRGYLRECHQSNLLGTEDRLNAEERTHFDHLEILAAVKRFVVK
jgi:hypothetical protein